MTTENNISARIKNKAHDLGFDICGIAKARCLAEYGPDIESWIKAGMNDKIGYLAREIDKRLNPEFLLPDAKSLVVTGLSYYAENMQKDPEAPLLSIHTYGIDYHEVIKTRLECLFTWLRSFIPEVKGRAVVDTSPILEKAWAREAGLGWQGKNSVLINKKIGSFFFIGILILNVDLDYDPPFTGECCGECRICIEACPTGAINDNRTIDARKCIANLTIENRGAIPGNIVPYLGRRVYGCDRCQEVCPWNRGIKPNSHAVFVIDNEITEMSLNDWKNLSREQFLKLFKRSSMKRVKYEKMMSNIEAAVRSMG